MKKITVKAKRPNDCHVHLRRGKMLQNVLPFHNIFGHAIVIGNTLPDNIVTAQDAASYRGEIMMENPEFIPHMTIMLVRDTTKKTIERAHRRGVRFVKYIPAATSTGSSAEKGIPLWMLSDYYPEIEIIWKNKMHLLLHVELAFDPENKGRAIPHSEREHLGIPYLRQLVKAFPGLKITVEHVSTKKMIDFINQAPDYVRATITAHHTGPYYDLTVSGYDHEAFHKGEIRDPDIFCLPILKGVDDVDAVIKAATSGNPKYMFGSDSAPHPSEHKTLENPKPGIFSAPTALPRIATVFSTHTDMNVKLLNAFLHDNSCRWYGFPKSNEIITFTARKWKVPENYKGIVPFLAGEKIYWKASR